jgi:hypothetical protein
VISLKSSLWESLAQKYSVSVTHIFWDVFHALIKDCNSTVIVVKRNNETDNAPSKTTSIMNHRIYLNCVPKRRPLLDAKPFALLGKFVKKIKRRVNVQKTVQSDRADVPLMLPHS